MPPRASASKSTGCESSRTDQFAGLVFGTLSPEAPPLARYIGNLIGSKIGRVMRGKPKMLGTTSQILHNNWKLYIENVKDTYHASLLHTFFTTFGISRLTQRAASSIGESGGHHASYTRGRHAAASRIRACRHPLVARGLPARDPRLLDAVDEIGDGITCRSSACSRISCCSRSTTAIAVRLVLPKGPDETELQWTYIGFEDDDAAMTERRLQQANLVGPAGYVSMEDGAAAASSSARSPAPRMCFGGRDGRLRARLRREPRHRSVGARLLEGVSRLYGHLGRVFINRPAMSAFEQTGH